MRIIASGDHHFNGDSRFAETVRVHDWIAEQVERERPDAFLSGGDVFDQESNQRERDAVADWLARVAEVCPVLVAVGNHDRPRECEFMGRLKTRHPIIVEPRCGVYRIGDAAIAAVAWPNRSSLLAMMGREGSGEKVDAAAAAALRSILLGLGSQLREHSGPRLLVMHAMVDGSKTSTGQPLIGMPMNVGVSDLALAGATLGVLAHIHCPQEFSWDSSTFLYTGSPYRTAFGENEEKSILLADVSTAGAEWQRVATPATRMLDVSAEWVPGLGLVAFDATGADGAEVRFRYEVDSDQREAARAAAQEIADKLRSAGAVLVQVEERVRSTTHARAPEVAAAKTTADKLAALWKARGFDPGDRREGLMVKVEELEGRAA